MNTMKSTVVIFPSAGAGHLVSMIELAKRVLHFNPAPSITMLLMRNPLPSPPASAHMKMAASTGFNIRFIHLPPVEVAYCLQDVRVETFVSLYVESHESLVSDHLRSLSASTHVSAFVIDFFCTTMIDVAAQFNIPTYVFFTSGAYLLSLMLHFPTLDATIPSDFVDSTTDIAIPGMPSLPPHDLPKSRKDRKNDAYKWMLFHSRKLHDVKGILVNTSAELEPRLADAAIQLVAGDGAGPTVLPIGPLLALEESKGSDHECIRWLDHQPDGSVVFLCFGSMGALPDHQILEMARGLELSGHRFLWSLKSRRPGDGFSLPREADLEESLPEGFLDRTRDMGLVWPSWVPQVAILSHRAVGGFVSHCGWNSTLESIWFGVPLIAWPIFAEQRMNAFLLVNDLGLGLGLKKESVKDDAFVKAEELEKTVKQLMEGEQGERVRKKLKAMKESARKAVEDGGSSYHNLAMVVAEWSGDH